LTLEPRIRQEFERRRRTTHDTRFAPRLSAVLWVADGTPQHEVAELLGVTERHVRKWLRTDRATGLETLGSLPHRGDPGKPRPAQIEQLKAEIATGRFLAAQPIRDGVDATFHVTHTPRGTRDLLPRIGVSHHNATDCFWKANPDKQKELIHTHEQQKQEADGRKARR
jgi:transposase